MASPEGQPRTWKEKAMDVGFSAFSVVTLPAWIIAGIGALATANLIGAAGFGLLASSDVVTIRDTFRKEKTPILNPSWWVDQVWRGRNRLGGGRPG